MSTTPPAISPLGPLVYLLGHRRLTEVLLLAALGGGGLAGAVLLGSGAVLDGGRPALATGAFGVGAAIGLLLHFAVAVHAPADARACTFMWAGGVLAWLASWVDSPAWAACLTAAAAASAVICWGGLWLMLARTFPRRWRRALAGWLILAALLHVALVPLIAFWPIVDPPVLRLQARLLPAWPIAAAVVATAVRYRRAPVRASRWFAFAWVQFLASFWHGMRRAGRPRLPVDGPAVVAVTHVSTVDPLLMQASCGRLLQWMIAKEYYDLWWLGWAYRLAGCIPVRRGQRDVGAPREALRVLEAGGVVGIFPAGGIQLPDAPPRPLHLGAAQLALRAGVPLIPVRIRNIQHRGMAADLLRPHRGVVVEWGRPIELDDLYPHARQREALVEATERLAAFLERA